jgi:hypothetical protein
VNRAKAPADELVLVPDAAVDTLADLVDVLKAA